VSKKEATARIKINKLLEASGWRFFPEGGAPSNIRLEPSVTIKSTDLDALGDRSRRAARGLHSFEKMSLRFPHARDATAGVVPSPAIARSGGSSRSSAV
jgi:hypothetical protein